jgi:hypothetical protein
MGMINLVTMPTINLLLINAEWEGMKLNFLHFNITVSLEINSSL